MSGCHGKYLEFTANLLNYIEENNISEARALLGRLREEKCINETCMADINVKKSWLQATSQDAPNYTLLQYMASTREIPLLEAIKKHRTAILVAMVDNGLDVNFVKTEEMGWTVTPLEGAVRSMNMKAAYLLLKTGADPNTRNCYLQSPLASAVQLSRGDFVRLFLNATKGKEVTGKHRFGITPFLTLNLLTRALQPSDPEILNLLLQYGADVNAKDEQTGMYALHLALLFYSGSVTLSVMQVLLKHGAKPNLRTTDDRTALHMVCCSKTRSSGSKEMSARKKCTLVTLLLRYGADPSACDKQYNTALHLAAQSNLPKVAEMLLEKDKSLLYKRNVDGNKPMALATPGSAVKKLLDEYADELSNFSTASVKHVACPMVNLQLNPPGYHTESGPNENIAIIANVNRRFDILKGKLDEHLCHCPLNDKFDIDKDILAI